MAIGDLFKSKQERERDQAKKRRKAFREAENAVDAVKDRARKLQLERDKKWGEARQYLRDGQKGASQRCLQSCRASELLIQKLEMKKWVFEQLLTKLELAKTDQEFAQSLSAINTVVNIDPDAVADVLGEVEDKLGEQVNTDKLWEKMHGKEMEGVEGAMTDVVPTVDQMFKDLEDEVAADQEETMPSRRKETQDPAASERQDTAALRERARKIIEGGQP